MRFSGVGHVRYTRRVRTRGWSTSVLVHFGTTQITMSRSGPPPVPLRYIQFATTWTTSVPSFLLGIFADADDNFDARTHVTYGLHTLHAGRGLQVGLPPSAQIASLMLHQATTTLRINAALEKWATAAAALLCTRLCDSLRR